MKLRKKILLAGCGILFVIALFQCVASSNNSIKTLKLEKDYNEITIQNSTETIVLQKQADQNWTVSKNQYAVNDAEFDSILDALQNLQLLEKVATASSDDVKEKYDLIEGKVITVTVKNADKIIVLDNGRIVEEGTHNELTLKRGYYYNLVKNQLELGN